MKTVVKNLIIILFFTSLCKCEYLVTDKKYSVTLMNNAEYSIGCYFTLGGYYGTYYPDTLLPSSNSIYIIKEIKSGNRYHADSSFKWEEIYSRLPKDTMSVFVFHSDTLKKHIWEEVRDRYMILKRYDLSFDDLKDLKFEITYPPNEKMKDMKMYPPYGE